MNQKTFCPFLKGNCNEECMFFCIGGSVDKEGTARHCLIAKTLIEFPDSKRQEEAFSAILNGLTHP